MTRNAKEPFDRDALRAHVNELRELYNLMEGFRELHRSATSREVSMAAMMLINKTREAMYSLAADAYSSDCAHRLELFVLSQLTDAWLPAQRITERAQMVLDLNVEHRDIELTLDKLWYAGLAERSKGRGWQARKQKRRREFFHELHELGEGLLTPKARKDQAEK